VNYKKEFTLDTVLIVDDDPEILDTVGFLLEDAGYGVITATNGQSMYSEIEHNSPNLIILDLSLGNENGLELAMHLRKISIIPIIMLTGKGRETDRVVGLELGADDYITKPYSSAELLARIKSVLRRSVMTLQSQTDKTRSIGTFRDWKCDMTARILLNPEGNEITLSSGEFSLLGIFLKNPNKALSRERLLDLSDREETFDRSIDVQIMRLRRKIEADPSDPQFIKAIRSVGYIFTVNVDWI
jgi:two-component system phosphate regulon response regulator OmpR